MGAIEVLGKEAIEKAMRSSTRQYLVGELSLPQDLEYLHDPNVEAGITEYAGYAVEKPHTHTRTTEYIYMLEGQSKYFCVETEEETMVKKGDFFLIRAHTTYAQKSIAGTKLLFFKFPSGNDKVEAEDDGRLKYWYDAWENVVGV